MLNPFRWKFRSLEEPCTPTGPNVNNAKPFFMDLSGNRFSISLPAPTSAKYVDQLRPHTKYNINQQSDYHSEYSRPDDPRLPILAFSWGYYGPLFTGLVAELNCVAAIISVKPRCEGFTLFRSAHLESYIESDLRHVFSNEDEINFGRARTIAPVNWAVVTANETIGVQYEEHSVPGDAGVRRSRIVTLPISEERYLELTFHYHPQAYLKDLNESNALINPAPMDALVDSIIDSIDIELSEQSKQERQQVLDQYPDEKLSEYRAPFKFTTEAQDKEWADHQKEQVRLAKIFAN
ncbi:hypothetical protein SIN8267_00114 [Sinobacterium norvegicum]|uniref:Uncharacterized protein n=1 Tax=Sinobacterium norvegicum TaxID=1641715 RepID=A0ABM9AA80_9GAMM|nr:hypothetical protein [Sinobacterium norvegicum]CAH0990031.1 hypothetical protein SIN8267_00114 [Sinobacterium norvegicum]